MVETSCQSLQQQVTSYMQTQSNEMHTIEKFVVATIIFSAVVFLLGGLKKRFAGPWLKVPSTACYMAVPSLISYTLGLMGEPTDSNGTKSMFRGVYGSWAVFLMFTYASFDNLTAFNLEEINGRSKLLFQFLTQSGLLVLLVYSIPSKKWFLPFVLVFFVVCLKLVERYAALAHAAGVTNGIRENLRKISNFVDKDGDEKDYSQVDEVEADPISMQGFKYLVGPKYSTTKDGKIVDGVTLENVWGCNGRLLSSEMGGDLDGKLKDTCLSFALFWMLLGKVRGYPNLYAGSSSKSMKAWKLVRDGLFVEHERAFRVIEVELVFFQDYFYSKYMFFYLNGFYWKLVSLLAFPIMFWYYTKKAYDYENFNSGWANSSTHVNPNLNPNAFATLTLVLFGIEVIQLCMFVTSRWYAVILLCYYAKRKVGLHKWWCFEGIIGAICRVSLHTRGIFYKSWKRRLDQYSLIDSCTGFSTQSKFLEALCAVFGYPLSNPGIKQGRSVALSTTLKSAVIVSLQTNGQNLSNGISSLRRSKVEEKLSWACKFKSNSETILVWHIATSICEMKLTSQQQKVEGFEVATKLSKYCAYLLAFAPLLFSIPVIEAEVICVNVVNEARALLKKPFSPCGKVEEVNKYEKLRELLTRDKEVGGEVVTTLQKGVKLGEDLLSIHGDEKRWKILAEFWAELILFLAPSNNNEMAHAAKLAEGGEFITHLWALLFHAGIGDRNN